MIAGLKNRTNKQKQRAKKGFLGMVVISIFLHFIGFYSLFNSPDIIDNKKPAASNEVKIRFIDKKIAKNTLPKKEDPLEAKKIIETPQEETKKPEKADYLGSKNHYTEKETTLAKMPEHNQKAADFSKEKSEAISDNKKPKPLQKQIAKENNKKQLKENKQTESLEKKEVNKEKQKENQIALKNPAKEAPVSIKKSSIVDPQITPRNSYEELLATAAEELTSEVSKGYQEYLKGDMQKGDFIDINTQEYRYVGYFTSMRKAIELVWSYPMDAARKGFHGAVDVKFTIHKNGKVSDIEVLDSSGFRILDESIVEAISLAAPFSPLPEGFGKERINITGTFTYVLRTF